MEFNQKKHLEFLTDLEVTIANCQCVAEGLFCAQGAIGDKNYAEMSSSMLYFVGKILGESYNALSKENSILRNMVN